MAYHTPSECAQVHKSTGHFAWERIELRQQVDHSNADCNRIHQGLTHTLWIRNACIHHIPFCNGTAAVPCKCVCFSCGWYRKERA